MDRDSVSASFLDHGLHKQVVRKGHSADGIGESESLDRGLTFVILTQRKEMCTQRHPLHFYLQEVQIWDNVSISSDWEGGTDYKALCLGVIKGQMRPVPRCCTGFTTHSSRPLRSALDPSLLSYILTDLTNAENRLFLALRPWHLPVPETYACFLCRVTGAVGGLRRGLASKQMAGSGKCPHRDSSSPLPFYVKNPTKNSIKFDKSKRANVLVPRPTIPFS